jgi:hypothetical protein
VQILAGVSSGAKLAQYLVVAGGGGGGGNQGDGGGGAGGVRCTKDATGGGGSLETPFLVLAGVTYTITVGGGGLVVGATTAPQASTTV